MTNNHPDQIDIDIDEILKTFVYLAVHGYGVSEDRKPYVYAVKMLMLKEREAEVKKAQMYIPDDEYGHYLRGRIQALEDEIKALQG